MEIFEQIPVQLILFFILYGVTGAVPLVAALYLLLRKGNAFAPGVTPPVRLRRWAASFFALSALGHVWWLLFCIYSSDLHFQNVVTLSASYVTLVMFDIVMLLTSLAGTLLSMLQDRRRPVWPVFAAMIPFVGLGVVFMVSHAHLIMLIAVGYILLLYVIFTVYMVFAVRRYGQWLNDNYADLENKRVWLSQAVTLGCLLLFFLYILIDINIIPLLFLMHFTELVLFGLLLWRVETLPHLDSLTPNPGLTPNPSPKGEGNFPGEGSDFPQTQTSDTGVSAPLSPRREGGGEAGAEVEAVVSDSPVNIDLSQIERLLEEHCVSRQLYLQHDLTLSQLARAIGTNRSYLSQYFSRQGITYNTYINNLRINFFIRRYREAVLAGQPVIAQQLASDSGYHSYSTFSLAFKQRTGLSVTAWMRGSFDN